MTHVEEAARVFKILSVETRVKMIDLLRRRSKQEKQLSDKTHWVSMSGCV